MSRRARRYGNIPMIPRDDSRKNKPIVFGMKAEVKTIDPHDIGQIFADPDEDEQLAAEKLRMSYNQRFNGRPERNTDTMYMPQFEETSRTYNRPEQFSIASDHDRDIKNQPVVKFKARNSRRKIMTLNVEEYHEEEVGREPQAMSKRVRKPAPTQEEVKIGQNVDPGFKKEKVQQRSTAVKQQVRVNPIQDINDIQTIVRSKPKQVRQQKTPSQVHIQDHQNIHSNIPQTKAKQPQRKSKPKPKAVRDVRQVEVVAKPKKTKKHRRQKSIVKPRNPLDDMVFEPVINMKPPKTKTAPASKKVNVEAEMDVASEITKPKVKEVRAPQNHRKEVETDHQEIQPSMPQPPKNKVRRFANVKQSILLPSDVDIIREDPLARAQKAKMNFVKGGNTQRIAAEPEVHMEVKTIIKPKVNESKVLPGEFEVASNLEDKVEDIKKVAQPRPKQKRLPVKKEKVEKVKETKIEVKKPSRVFF